ncbi:MAG: hypothetical protein AMJ93_06675 [Anaerolineae bacterium SM23_84]|nr:MAG: hypothetical protein AMJ93_06675 [Anaerolineae bacterium SM23_84]
MLRAVGAYALGDSDLGDRLLRMSSTLHGGLADTKDGPCGALVSGILIIGALYGRSDATQDDSLGCAIARQWRARFRREFGTDDCATLRDTVKVGPEYPSPCGTIMVRAARMLAELLDSVAESHKVGTGTTGATGDHDRSWMDSA